MVDRVYELALPGHLQSVLVLLAQPAPREGGVVWVARETIAHKLGKQERSVQRALSELRSMGLIHRTQGGHRGQVTHYALTLGNGAVKSPRQEGMFELAAQAAKTEVSEAFATFYDQLYPRKVHRRTAEKAFMSALKRATPEQILKGAARFAGDPNLPDASDPEEVRYIPHPSTWLNADAWLDEEPLPPRRKRSNGHQPRDRAAEILRGAMGGGGDATRTGTSDSGSAPGVLSAS